MYKKEQYTKNDMLNNNEVWKNNDNNTWKKIKHEKIITCRKIMMRGNNDLQEITAYEK